MSTEYKILTNAPLYLNERSSKCSLYFDPGEDKFPGDFKDIVSITNELSNFDLADMARKILEVAFYNTKPEDEETLKLSLIKDIMNMG